MRGLSLVGAALLCCALPAVGEAQQVRPIERVVLANRPTKIGRFINVDQDCRPLQFGSIAVLESAEHGQINLLRGRDNPAFPTFHPRAKCNNRKVASTELIYSPAPGFAGEDNFVIEIVGDYGAAIRQRYHVVIR